MGRKFDVSSGVLTCRAAACAFLTVVYSAVEAATASAATTTLTVRSAASASVSVVSDAVGRAVAFWRTIAAGAAVRASVFPGVAVYACARSGSAVTTKAAALAGAAEECGTAAAGRVNAEVERAAAAARAAVGRAAASTKSVVATAARNPRVDAVAVIAVVMTGCQHVTSWMRSSTGTAAIKREPGPQRCWRTCVCVGPRGPRACHKGFRLCDSRLCEL